MCLCVLCVCVCLCVCLFVGLLVGLLVCWSIGWTAKFILYSPGATENIDVGDTDTPPLAEGGVRSFLIDSTWNLGRKFVSSPRRVRDRLTEERFPVNHSGAPDSEALNINNAITTINLHGNSIGKEVAQAIAETSVFPHSQFNTTEGS